MLTHSIMKREGILVLRPVAPLSKDDFADLSSDLDAYFSEHTRLCGVMIQANSFPGWEDLDGFIAHINFVRNHHKQVERVAVVTDSALAILAEVLGKRFVSAEVRHFPSADEAMALEWLRAT